MDTSMDRTGMHRGSRLRPITLLACVLLAACSSPAPRGPVLDAKGSGPFIRETAIDFPNALAQAVVVNHTDFVDVADGIGVHYRATALPDARLDLYVYPAGKADMDDAVHRAQQGFIESLRGAKDEGTYSEYAVEGEDPFTVTMADGRALPGVKTRIAIRMDPGGEWLASRAYLFYRQFYTVKLRMTAAASEAFRLDATGDAIARELVPKLHVRSMGDCVHVNVVREPLPAAPGGPRRAVEANVAGTEVTMQPQVDPKQFIPLLLEAMKTDLGCIGVRSEWPAVADGDSRRKLAFTAESWQQEPR